MKRLIAVIIVLCFLPNLHQFSQQKKDSLYSGRTCNIILFNGFEAEGRIISRGLDTVLMKTEAGTIKIPIAEIRLIVKEGETLLDVLEKEDDIRQVKLIEQQLNDEINRVKIDTSAFCTVYLEGNHKIKGVKLIALNDSIIGLLKDSSVTYVNYTEVNKIFFRRNFNNALYGCLIGAGTGFISGFILHLYTGYATTYGNLLLGCTIMSVPGALAGLVAGIFTSFDKTYYFNGQSARIKSVKIRNIIHKHLQ